MSNIDKLSIVIPVFNEVDSLEQLVTELDGAIEDEAFDHEFVFIDDGSSDGSWEKISAFVDSHKNALGIRLRRNFGKSQALHAGITEATGDAVLTIDADLQDDPRELHKLLAEYRSGADIVIGWKEERKDTGFKVFVSFIFNSFLNFLSNTKLHDINSGFKLIRSDVFRSVSIYGDMHRFIPLIANSLGFRVVEVPVNHRARKHGSSKFGIERYYRALVDVLTVLTITRFEKRPSHLFCGIGFSLAVLGLAILTYLTILWFLYPDPIGNRPLLLFGILFVLVGMQFALFGLLAEFVLHRTIENQKFELVSERKRS